jgi:hypothetical protein
LQPSSPLDTAVARLAKAAGSVLPKPAQDAPSGLRIAEVREPAPPPPSNGFTSLGSNGMSALKDMVKAGNAPTPDMSKVHPRVPIFDADEATGSIIAYRKQAAPADAATVGTRIKVAL